MSLSSLGLVPLSPYNLTNYMQIPVICWTLNPGTDSTSQLARTTCENQLTENPDMIQEAYVRAETAEALRQVEEHATGVKKATAPKPSGPTGPVPWFVLAGAAVVVYFVLTRK